MDGMTNGMTKAEQVKIKEAIEMCQVDTFIVPNVFKTKEEQEQDEERKTTLHIG